MAESNLARRVLVAILGAPGLVSMFWLGGLLLRAPLLIIVAGGTIEFLEMQKHKGLHPWKRIGTAASLIWCVWVHQFGIENSIYPLFFLFLTCLILPLFSARIETRFADATFTLLGTLYVGLLGSFTLVVRNLPISGGSDGQTIAMLVLLAIWVTDIAAYSVGGFFGKRHPFPKISPGKTGAGFVGGLAGALCTTLVGANILGISTFTKGLGIGLVVGLGAQVGDLVESMMKRDAGVKDSSTIIPGHGGILDRFDSFLFTFPLVYFYLAMVHP